MVSRESSSSFRTLRVIEGTIGAFFAFVVGFVLLVFGGNIVYVEFDRTIKAIAMVVLWATFVIIEGVFLYQLKIALEQGLHPLAPGLAMKTRIWPLLLRPFPVVWHLAHFALALTTSLLLDHLIVASSLPLYLRGLLCAGITFTIAYSANMYALLAIRAVGAGESFVEWAWRWRFAMDVAIALAAAYLPLTGRTQ